MWESITNFFKKRIKAESHKENSKNAAKERLHLVLMQDRANMSADFLDMMKQEIIEVIKKYIDVDENAIDVKLTNQTNEDGTNGAPALYANIPIISIKNKAEVEKEKKEEKEEKEVKTEEIVTEKKEKEKVDEEREGKTESKKEERKEERIEETKQVKKEKKEAENKAEVEKDKDKDKTKDNKKD